MRLHLYTGYDKQVLVERLIEQGHDVSAVVVPRAEKYRGYLDAFLTRVGDLGIPVFEVRRGDISETVTLDDPATVLVSVGFPLILRPEAFSRYQHAVNFHPTLLPRHRGKYLNYVLLEADTETGITAHLIDEGIDTGPILAQEVIEVSSFDTIRSIKRRTLDMEPNFVLAVLGDIDRLVDVAVPQDESLATLHLEPREPSDSELDASLPLHDLLPTIRASDPEFYPAYFWLDGHRVVVSLAREDRPQTEQDMI